MTAASKRSTVYFDNAATTWPKPVSVRNAVDQALTIYGANPGRSGYPMGLAASRAIYQCRESAAEFFNLDNPSNVVFVQNCTIALNIVIKGLFSGGGRAVVSDLEHNAVMRPLHSLSAAKQTYDVAEVIPGNDAETVKAFQKCIRPDTRAIICLHASNVFGTRMPIRELGRLAHQYGLKFIVDGSQSAGILPINMQENFIDFLCVPGHKGLYGPMGVGMLLYNSEDVLPSFYEGGTGSLSRQLAQPTELPDRFESGTLNTSGICGLHAGISFVQKHGIKSISEHENKIIQYVYEHLTDMKGVRLYTPYPDLSHSVPVLSFNIEGRHSEETALELSKYGIAVRAGLQCAPSAHQKFKTLETGVVRLAPSVFTSMKDAQYVCKTIMRISK